MNKRISTLLLPAILIPGTLTGCAAAGSTAAAGQPATGHATTGTATTGTATTGTATTGSASAATVADVTGATHIAVWSVNSDGPDFQAILTGGVGDHGPGVTVHPDGSVDPSHSSELELKLAHGSFRLSIAKLDATFVKAVGQWPYNKQTCSIHGAVTATAPVVAGSGTGAYRGITGGFTLTISLDEDYIKGPTCSEETAFQSQLIMITGTGSIRV